MQYARHNSNKFMSMNVLSHYNNVMIELLMLYMQRNWGTITEILGNLPRYPQLVMAEPVFTQYSGTESLSSINVYIVSVISTCQQNSLLTAFLLLFLVLISSYFKASRMQPRELSLLNTDLNICRTIAIQWLLTNSWGCKKSPSNLSQSPSTCSIPLICGANHYSSMIWGQ